MQPISFLPQDKIDQGIQNLGNTLSQINESKIARKQQQIEGFKSMIDVSLQGIKNGHYEEAMGDLDKLTNASRDIYIKAENENRPVTAMESLKLSNLKKDLLYKVNTSKMLMDDYTNAMVEAAKLEQQQKLAPGVKQKLQDWLNAKEPIGSKQFPSTLIETIYSPEERAKLEKMVADAVNAEETMVPGPGGTFNKNVYRDPKAIADQANKFLTNNPKYLATLRANGEDPKNVIPSLINTYKGNKQTIVQKSAGQGGVIPLEKKVTWFVNPDGTQTASPLVTSERSVIIDGKSKDIEMVQADRNPKTGITTYTVKEKERRPVVGKYGKYEDVWVQKTYTNQQSDAFGTFFEDVEKRRGPGDVIKPTKTSTSTQPSKSWRPK